MATSVIMMELLGRGVHAHPRRGCNVLEYASVLAGERWSSRPRSVHPALADVAGMINDQMTDDNRRLLTPFAPWLLGTSTADPRAWPAITGACIRAVLAWASEPAKPRLKTDLDTARNWLDEASRPLEGRRPPWAGCRERRWARHAICTALLTVAAPAYQDDADTRLCQVLLDCVNECRRLAGEPAVDPRLPLADCPQHLAVERHMMWLLGCDWMEAGYRPARTLPQGPADAAQAQPGHGETESTAVSRLRGSLA